MINSFLNSNQVVDTVLAKLLSLTDQTSELYELIDATNDIVIDEVQAVFEKNGQYNALCKLYANTGDEEKLLECWAKYDGLFVSIIFSC